MRWNRSILLLLIVVADVERRRGDAAISRAWPSISGNDTGGIIPYAPDLEGRLSANRAETIARAGAGSRT